MSSLGIVACAWILALVIDRLFGEFPNRWHPVVWIGRTISWGERLFLGRGARAEFWGGALLALVIPFIFAGISWWSIQALTPYPFWQMLLMTFWFKASFALKALGGAAEAVRLHLLHADIDGARAELRSLCSRNASQLDEAELTEAAISSLAENLSDSVIAPWFFAMIFGVPGAIFYRAVNTMDAMIGYKNHYKNLGCAAARLDDLLNLIPARLTSVFLLIFHRRAPIAWTIARRDHALTPSPNGGWPMATMAGLLGIRLRKPGVYSLGDAERASSLSLMQEAWRHAERAAYLAWPLFFGGALLCL